MAGVRKGLAVRSGMARTEISAPPQGGVLPLPEAVYIRLPLYGTTSEHHYSGLKRLPYASAIEIRGSFWGKGAEPL